MRTSLFVLFCLILPAGSACAEEVLLSPGGKTEWSYLDGNANPGEDWANPGFDDSQWKKGKAPLGYGKEVARANPEAGKLTSRTKAPRAIRESSELVTRVPAATLKFERWRSTSRGPPAVTSTSISGAPDLPRARSQPPTLTARGCVRSGGARSRRAPTCCRRSPRIIRSMPGPW